MMGLTSPSPSGATQPGTAQPNQPNPSATTIQGSQGISPVMQRVLSANTPQAFKQPMMPMAMPKMGGIDDPGLMVN